METSSDYRDKGILCSLRWHILAHMCHPSFLYRWLPVHVNSKQYFWLLYVDCNLQNTPKGIKRFTTGETSCVFSKSTCLTHTTLRERRFISLCFAIWPCNSHAKLISMNTRKQSMAFGWLRYRKRLFSFSCILTRKIKTKAFRLSCFFYHIVLNKINVYSIWRCLLGNNLCFVLFFSLKNTYSKHFTNVS